MLVRRDRVLMLGADLPRATKQRLGSSRVSHGFVQRGHVLERSRDLGIIGAQGSLEDGQSASIKRLRLPITPLGLVERSQVVQTLRDVGMVWAPAFFKNGQRAEVKRFGLRVLSFDLIELT